MSDAEKAFEVFNKAWQISKPYLLDEDMTDEKWSEFIRCGQAEWLKYSKKSKKLCNLFSSILIALQEYKGECERRL